ncbi:uncharacterized protein [Phaseolus vulgaris]|uniref:uncharacterized protein n=1 Tax=Phaseolus vulgaris TaxID=3885 RepID=UPI0035CA7744
MIVYTFRKGVRPRSFGKSLNCKLPKTFSKVRRQVVEHIVSKGEAYEKCMPAAPARPMAQIRTQPARVHEVATERKNPDRKRIYETRRTQPRGRAEGRREGSRPLRHNFVVELKDLIVVPNIAERLRPPVKSDKVLGPHKESWCEFHEAFGHHINNCLALGYQLDELVKNGFLKDYLVEKQTGQSSGSQPERSERQQHEVPIHDEVHTIVGGFSGGGCTASQRKRYARSVMSVEAFEDHSPDVDITLTKEDLRDVVPHDNDPIVISFVMAGRMVHRALVDQGSSADVMFWPTFENLRLSPNQLRPYGGYLYGFAGDQVEVRGYIELRTTFTDGAASRTEKIRYLVVNAPSTYNILLGRSTLNKIGVVPSTRHMKVKLPSMEGVVITIRYDQKKAKKCYENSLKNKRSICHVTTTPPPGVEPEQEDRRVVDTVLEVAAEGDVIMEDVEARSESAARVEEERNCPEIARELGIVRALIANEKRPRPVEDWLEKKIDGKTFKLGKTLDGETQNHEEQNARADLLAKLASSGKGGRQRTVTQETLKTPRAFVADHQVLQVCKSMKGMTRSHKSLTQETLRTSRVRAHPVGEAKMTQVCAIHEPDTWITPYQRYMADSVLQVDLTEARKVKKNSSKFTLIDGELYRFGFTHPLLVCVHGEKCMRIMAELHEGICGSHIGGRALTIRTLRAGYYWPTIREDCKRYAQRCKQCQQHAD